MVVQVGSEEEGLYSNIYDCDHASSWLEKHAVVSFGFKRAPQFMRQETTRSVRGEGGEKNPLANLVDLDAQVSPISLIPPEILSRIFFYVVSGDNAVAYAFNSSVPPIITVCKQWRIVARAAPLWDTVPLTAVPGFPDSSWLLHQDAGRPTNNQRLRMWLAMSQSPLDVYQKDLLGETPKSGDWKALFDTSRPWKHFRCASPGLVKRFLSSSLDISSMETLHLRNPNIWEFPANWEMIFPKLKDISLVGQWITSALSHLKAPQIYTVTLGKASLHAQHILDLSQNFQTVAELHLQCVTVASSVNGSMISPFRHLEKYEGVDSTECDLSLFQSSPLLRDLTIATASFFLSSLEAASLQSVTHLNLRLSRHSMSEVTTSNLLAAVPQLSELSLTSKPKERSRRPVASQVLIPLGYRKPILIPMLRVLFLQGIHVPTPKLLKAASLLRSGIIPDSFKNENRDGGSSLRTVLLITINGCRGVPDVSEANFKELNKALGEYWSNHVFVS